MKAYELIADPKNWIQGLSSTKNLDGSTCYCALGAIGECYRIGVSLEKYNYAVKKLANYIRMNSYGWAIVAWNDAPNRTHAEVVAALKACDL